MSLTQNLWIRILWIICTNGIVYSSSMFFANVSVAWFQRREREQTFLTYVAGEPSSWVQNISIEPSLLKPIHIFKNVTHLNCDFHDKILIGTDIKHHQIWGIKFIEGEKHQYNIFKGTSSAVKALAVDWVTNLVYWTDALYQSIMVASFITFHSQVYELIDLGINDSPAGIAVHPAEGFLFWTDISDKPRLERSTLSGEYRSILIGKDLHKPMSLAVDHFENLLYMLDVGLGKLLSCDLSGNNIRTVYRFPDVTSNDQYSFDIYQDLAFITGEFQLKAINVSTGMTVFTRNLKDNSKGVISCGPWKQTSKTDYCGGPRWNQCPGEGLCVSTKGYKAQCTCIGAKLQETGPWMSFAKSCGHHTPTMLLLGKKFGLFYIEQNFADAEGLQSKKLIDGPYTIGAVAVDSQRGIVYFSDITEKVIYQTAIYKRSETKAIILAAKSVQGLAYDWISRNLYWTDSGLKSIMVSRYNGENVIHLLRMTNSTLKAIAVHPIRRFLFWTDIGRSTACIQRVNLDGKTGHRFIVMHPDVLKPVSLAIDFQTNRLIWLDQMRESIFTSTLNGRDRKLLHQHKFYGSNLQAIAVLKNYILYSDWHFGSTGIYAINKHDGTMIGHTKEIDPTLAMAFLHAKSQPQGSNPCVKNNGGCQHVCLPKRDGFTCVCAIGYRLQENGDCTSDIVYDEFLLVADQRLRRLYQIDLWKVELNALPIFPLTQPIDVAFDYTEMMVYWTDAQEASINRAKLNGHSHEVLIHNFSINFGEIAIETNSRLLYFIDYNSGSIGALSLKTKRYAMLIGTGLKHTFGLTIDPVSGNLFTTSPHETSDSLWSFHPNSDIANHAMTGLRDPRGIYCWNKTVYVAASGSVQAVEIDKPNRSKPTTVLRNVDPYDVRADYLFLYWTDKESGAVKRADRFTGGDVSILVKTNLFIQPIGLSVYDKRELEERADPGYFGFKPLDREIERWTKANFNNSNYFCQTPKIPMGRLVNSKPGLWVPHNKIISAQCFSGYKLSNLFAMVCRKGDWSHTVKCIPDPNFSIYGTLQKGYLKFTSSRILIVPEGLTYVNVICIGGGGGGYSGGSRYKKAGDGSLSKFRTLVAEGGKGGNRTSGGAGGRGTFSDGTDGGWERDACTLGGAAGGGDNWENDGSTIYPFCGVGGQSECPRSTPPKAGQPGPGGKANNGTSAGLYGGGGGAAFKMGAGGGGGFSRESFKVDSWEVIQVTVGAAGTPSHGPAAKGVVVISWGWPDFH